MYALIPQHCCGESITKRVVFFPSKDRWNRTSAISMICSQIIKPVCGKGWVVLLVLTDWMIRHHVLFLKWWPVSASVCVCVRACGVVWCGVCSRARVRACASRWRWYWDDSSYRVGWWWTLWHRWGPLYFVQVYHVSSHCSRIHIFVSVNNLVLVLWNNSASLKFDFRRFRVRSVQLLF